MWYWLIQENKIAVFGQFKKITIGYLQLALGLLKFTLVDITEPSNVL